MIGVMSCFPIMCRVTMHQVWIHRITTDELYERIGVKSIEYYIRVRTLRWVGHVARMDKMRLPRRLLTAWVANFRPNGGTEMTYGRSLERWLKHANLPIEFSEWSNLSPKTGRSGAPSSPRCADVST